jgi:ribose transport system substrate-binding protein
MFCTIIELRHRAAGAPRGLGAPLVACLWAAAAFAPFVANGQARASASPRYLDEMRRALAAATRRAPSWDGPRDGPPGVPGKTIAIVAEDLRNGGILGVAGGVVQAASVMGWGVRVFDAAGSPAGRDRAVADALAVRPDGLVLDGADASTMAARLRPFAERGVPVVGWHVGARAGALATGPVAMNVSTDPLDVARVTAMAAIVASGGRAGVVIFTDSNFVIAEVKAKAMAEVIRACQDCTLLEVRDVPISRSAEQMPAVTRELLARYGTRWTHALAINDIYFDYAVPELTKTGAASGQVRLLSAGDGSAAAFVRIQAGVFQVATVAEPLELHGWQLVDELNRLMARAPVSGYVAPVHLVTPENIAYDAGPRLRYDPDNGYREAYRRIWKR